MAESKKFGDFLKRLAHPEDQAGPEETELAEDAGNLWQKAAERYFLPQRFARVEKEIERLGRSATRVAGPDIADGAIAKIKRDHLGISIEDICKWLDTHFGGVQLPKRFQKLGFSTWHSIWLDKRYRNRVKRKISSVRAAAKPKGS